MTTAGRGQEEHDPLGGVLLTIDAHGAMEVAAVRRGGRPLGSVEILAAIVAMDAIGVWQTILLRTAFVTTDDVPRFPDQDNRRAGIWHNVPLTADATAGLEIAAQIAADYDLRPMPAGVLALGLVWDPSSGAARALLEGAEVDHAGLIELLQAEVLDVRLDGLGQAPLAGYPSLLPTEAVEVDISSRSAESAKLRRAPTEVRPRNAGSADCGPFAGALHDLVSSSHAAEAEDVTPGTLPLGAGAAMPAFAGALGARLGGATLLRRPSRRSTQPWVYGVGDRVLKIYALESLSEAEQRRVRAEASIGLALGDIEGVVPTLGVFDEQEHLVVEMPRMGPSVADHSRRGAVGREPQLSPELYARAIARVARTLEQMHARGLVHGHITPSNLLVDPRTGWLTVSDFSNARSNTIPDEPRRASRRDVIAAGGGPDVADAYIAPEQYDGERGPSVDQYALGVVARELLTAPGLPNLTTPVHDALQRATAPRPGDRFESIDAFGTALEQAVKDEAPKGFADRLASLRPHHRAALAPTVLAVLASIGFTTSAATDGPQAAGVPLVDALIATPLVAGLTWAGVVLAGALRRHTRCRTFTFRGRAPVTLIAAIAIGAAWIVVRGGNWLDVVSLTLVCTYGGALVVAGVPADAGRWIVRVARGWDRRRALSRPRRWALTTLVVGLGLGLATAPLIAAALWPGTWPDRPLADFPPLASVFNFRVLIGSRQAQRACDTVVALPVAPLRARCVDLGRIAGAIERADPVTKQPRLLFGAADSFSRFRVEEIPAPGTTRMWLLRAGSGGRQVGDMYTEGGVSNRVTVVIDRAVPADSSGQPRSVWLYELVQRPDAWKITGFRACTVGPPGTGAQPADCEITDTTPPDLVRRLMALARAKGAQL